MKIIDLTHPFTGKMPVYPGDPISSLVQSATIGKHGVADHRLETNMHVGTHIDAPAHMIEGGKKMHELPIELFFGRGRIIDTGNKSTLDINLLTRLNLVRNFAKDDIVLFYTGFSKYFKEEKYFTDFPVMTEALAKELVNRKIKMVGFDTPSPDKEPYLVHKILLEAGILIIENLTNLESLIEVEHFEIEAFPLRIAADAAPARVIAQI